MADRSGDQQVLGAVDFRRFAENRGATVLGQQVGGITQRRIGGDAGVAVGTAALHADHDVLDAFRGTFQTADGVEHLGHLFDGSGDAGTGAAGVLDIEDAEVRPLADVVALHPAS